MSRASIDDWTRASRGQRWRYAWCWWAQHVLDTVGIHNHFAGRRQQIHMGLRAALERESVEPLPVDRRADLDPETFRREYLATDTPVVLIGAAATWRCCQSWTPSWFAEHYGREAVLLLRAGPGQVPIRGTGEESTFAQVIGDLDHDGGRYARFSSMMHRNPELMEDFDGAWLERMRGARWGYGNFGLFVGGPHTATGLHSAMAPNLFVQVYGTKHWRIFPACYAPLFIPPVQRSPFFYSEIDASDHGRHDFLKRVPMWETVLEPGDVLFNPAFFWHQVHNRGPTIGVGYRWTSLRQALRVAPLQTLLTMTASNPNVLAVRHQTHFPRVLDQTEPQDGVTG